MVLTRLWKTMTGGRRAPSPLELFRKANQCRDAGRFEEASDLVARGLQLDPDNVVGHVLAGSLHVAFREMDLAKASFERVLAMDPTHPRALLGLARIAFEERDSAACTRLLAHALARYPDFPEAQALLDVVKTAAPVGPAAARLDAFQALRLDRLHLPADTREVLVTRAGGALILAHPRGARSEEVAARTAQVARVASAMLGRAGLGPLNLTIIEGAAEITFLRADLTEPTGTLVSLAFGRDVEITTGLAHLERVWAHCRAELSKGVA